MLIYCIWNTAEKERRKREHEKELAEIAKAKAAQPAGPKP